MHAESVTGKGCSSAAFPRQAWHLAIIVCTCHWHGVARKGLQMDLTPMSVCCWCSIQIAVSENSQWKEKGKSRKKQTNSKVEQQRQQSWWESTACTILASAAKCTISTWDIAWAAVSATIHQPFEALPPFKASSLTGQVISRPKTCFQHRSLDPFQELPQENSREQRMSEGQLYEQEPCWDWTNLEWLHMMVWERHLHFQVRESFWVLVGILPNEDQQTIWHKIHLKNHSLRMMMIMFFFYCELQLITLFIECIPSGYSNICIQQLRDFGSIFSCSSMKGNTIQSPKRPTDQLSYV